MGNKPKILFVLHFPPPMHGASMVGQYIKGSSLIKSKFNGLYINLGTSRSVAEIGIGGLKKWGRYFGILFKTVKHILSFRPDLIYITPTAAGPGFYKDAVVMLLARILGGQVIYHFHNKGIRTRQGFMLDNLLYQWVFKNSKVILLTRSLYDDIKKYVPEYQVNYCANGLPNALEVPERKVNKTVQLLFLSNLLLSKGIEVLLDAFFKLSGKGNNFNCNIIGDEADWTGMHLQQAIITRELSDRVSYKGKKLGTEKMLEYINTDIFVFPTYEDCFPLVLLESMQFGLPVISTDEGGVPDIVQNNITGFIIPRKNSTALAEKVAVLISNPTLRKEMGRNGRLKYEREFTLSHFENRLVHIFNKVLDE